MTMQVNFLTFAFAAALVCSQLSGSCNRCDAASVVVESTRVTALSSTLIRVEPIGTCSADASNRRADMQRPLDTLDTLRRLLAPSTFDEAAFPSHPPAFPSSY